VARQQANRASASAGRSPRKQPRTAFVEREALCRSTGRKDNGGGAEEEGRHTSEGAISWRSTALAFLFPALGGLLFGFDIGATSGALVSLTSAATGGVDWYGLSPFQSGLVVSSSLAGALASSIFAFFYGDDFGRRKEIMLAAVLYFFGALMESTSPTFGLLVLGRLLYGLGIGLAMHGVSRVLVPMGTVLTLFLRCQVHPRTSPKWPRSRFVDFSSH